MIMMGYIKKKTDKKLIGLDVNPAVMHTNIGRVRRWMYKFGSNNC